MHRHLKILFVLLFIFYDVSAEKLPKVYFQSSSKFLSLNDDGYQDTIMFTIYFREIKGINIKSFHLEIVNSAFQNFYSIQENLEKNKKEKYIYIWDGKNQKGDSVNEGEYKAILKVNYDYANLTKEYEITFYVIKDNHKVQLEFVNPLVILEQHTEQKKYLSRTEAIIFNKIYTNSFTSSESYILDPSKKILEIKTWIENVKDTVFWNGYVKNSPTKYGIYHYLFKSTTKENQNYYFPLPGILVFPYEIEYISFLNHYIVNPQGYGLDKDTWKPLNLRIITKELKEVSLKNHITWNQYYQIYCLRKGFFGSEWKYYKDGIGDISKEGILNILSRIPENENCQIIFFKNPEREFDFFKLKKENILTTVPIYVDTKKPEIKLSILESFRPNLNLYQDSFQNLYLKIKDNTFIESIEIKISISFNDSQYLIKEWKIPYFKIPQGEETIKLNLIWYGETKENIEIYSLENFILDIQIKDFAINTTHIRKSFKTDLFLKEKNEDYKICIPIKHFFKKEENIISTTYLDTILKEFKKTNKKYIYIYVHSFEKDLFNDLKKSERLAEKIYSYMIQKYPKEKIFYRGFGNLDPISHNKDQFSEYKSNRIEILFSDDLDVKEKL
ncbi:MAG: hypothetical protein ACK4UJ_10215 [Leptonema sp. (in: bacteria)]